MFINEGINDRFEGYYSPTNSITSDVEVDTILNIAGPDHIWFATDWHLFLYDKDNNSIKKNPLTEEYLRKQREVVGDHDVFIYLGDLSDDECQNYDELAKLLKDNLSGKYKIFILGNNDLQPESYYTNELGFDFVFHAYQYRMFTFSHLPMEKFPTTYNIHGHMHEWWDYNYQGVKYNNNIKIYTKEYNNYPINLREIVKKYNAGYYTKNIVE